MGKRPLLAALVRHPLQQILARGFGVLGGNLHDHLETNLRNANLSDWVEVRQQGKAVDVARTWDFRIALLLPDLTRLMRLKTHMLGFRSCEMAAR